MTGESTLQRIAPDELPDLLTRLYDGNMTDLALIGPSVRLSASPDDWPEDVPIADSMQVFSVTRVRDDFMVTFHAVDTPFPDVVEWFKFGMLDHGWVPEEPLDQLLLGLALVGVSQRAGLVHDVALAVMLDVHRERPDHAGRHRCR